MVLEEHGSKREAILKIAFQNRFVRGHLFVKMYFLAVGDRSKSLLIPGGVFAYSSTGTGHW